MRLFIYGMESSGASTFCLFLGQRPGSVAVVDLWSRCLAPPIETVAPVVLKATVTTTYSAEEHISSFRPHRSILFLRDPVAVYRSLTKYDYANYEGSVEDKLARFDREIAQLPFDLTLRYEDFVRRDPALLGAVEALGWPCRIGYYGLPRRIEQIRETNFAQSAWLKDEFNRGWAFGNFKGTTISSGFVRADHPPDVAAKVATLCPNLTALYAGNRS